MAETYEKVRVGRLPGMTLSRIVWNRFRAPTGELKIVERTLAHNPGLAALGPVLPYGTEFELVIPGVEEASKAVPVIRLWGQSE